MNPFGCVNFILSFKSCCKTFFSFYEPFLLSLSYFIDSILLFELLHSFMLHILKLFFFSFLGLVYPFFTSLSGSVVNCLGFYGAVQHFLLWCFVAHYNSPWVSSKNTCGAVFTLILKMACLEHLIRSQVMH